MERQAHDLSTLNRYRSPAVGGHDLNACVDLLDDGCTDEDRVKGLVETRDIELAFKALWLAAVRIAPDRDGKQAERLLVGQPITQLTGQQDHAGAGGEHRHVCFDAPAEWLLQTEFARQLVHGCALATRKDHAINRRQVVRSTHRSRARAQLLESADVLTESTLHRQHADADGAHSRWVDDVQVSRVHQPRPASSSSLGISLISRPFMARPKPLLTSSTTSGRS